MPRLFGLDIAALLRDGINSAGGVLTGTLTVVTPGSRTPGDVAAGTNPTTTVHAFEGFVDDRAEVRVNGTLVRAGGRIVSILGASLPTGVAPASSDRVTIEGVTYTVLGVSSDPAAAVYECTVES